MSQAFRKRSPNPINIENKIKTGFLVVIILTGVIGAVSLISMQKLSSITEKMYRHPFVVSNAARDINLHIVAMHRYMKDVALSKNKDQLNSAIDKVDWHEKRALANFERILDRFLGDKTKVREAHQAVLNWKPIRDEVTALMRAGRRDEAADITKATSNTSTKASRRLSTSPPTRPKSFIKMRSTRDTHT